VVSHASDGQGGDDSSGSGMAVTEVILLNTSMCRWPKKEGKDPPVTGKGTKACSFPHHVTWGVVKYSAVPLPVVMGFVSARPCFFVCLLLR
jgi:hypothetical protein